MKIGIIGSTGSGKTCYLLGLLRGMLRDKCGFSIRISDPKASGDLTGKMLNLADTFLPVNERFPAPNMNLEEYTFQLLDGGNKFDDIQWIDCPSELFSIDQNRLAKKIGSVDCLFMCVDGSRLQGTADDLDDIVDDFYNQVGMDLTNALYHISSCEPLPPICILITKYDAVSPALRNIETIQRYVKLCFPALFHRISSVVTLCPVSIGKNIAEGGGFAPWNVHLPMLIALYFYIQKMLPVLPGTSSLYPKMVAQKRDLMQAIGALPLFIDGEHLIWTD